jgi:predicted transcriptional regulator
MNIIQLLHPKALIDYVYDDTTCRQALEIMGNHGFTAVPVISHEGEYIRTLAEGDLLWFMINNELGGRKELEQYSISDVNIKRNVQVKPVSVASSIDDVLLMLINQNFVPVIDDRKMFIGIITRSDVLKYCHGRLKESAGATDNKEYERAESFEQDE